MACFRSVSRSRVDHLNDPTTVLSYVAGTLADSVHPMTLALLLDRDRRVLSVLRVDNTTDHDDVFTVAEIVVGGAAQRNDFSAVALASIRPGWRGDLGDLDDVDRWLELDDEFHLAGLELVEWFVFGRRLSLPRELVGEPPRW